MQNFDNFEDIELNKVPTDGSTGLRPAEDPLSNTGGVGTFDKDSGVALKDPATVPPMPYDSKSTLDESIPKTLVGLCVSTGTRVRWHLQEDQDHVLCWRSHHQTSRVAQVRSLGTLHLLSPVRSVAYHLIPGFSAQRTTNSSKVSLYPPSHSPVSGVQWWV